MRQRPQLAHSLTDRKGRSARRRPNLWNANIFPRQTEPALPDPAAGADPRNGKNQPNIISLEHALAKVSPPFRNMLRGCCRRLSRLFRFRHWFRPTSPHGSADLSSFAASSRSGEAVVSAGLWFCHSSRRNAKSALTFARSAPAKVMARPVAGMSRKPALVGAAIDLASFV